MRRWYIGSNHQNETLFIIGRERLQKSEGGAVERRKKKTGEEQRW